MPSFPTFFPHQPDADNYIVKKIQPAPAGAGPRVPPRDTWISEKYGTTDEQYLASGQRDMSEMLDVLRGAGVTLETFERILEFGCGDGRMIRALEPLADRREIWGTDIEASRILWCKQHLSPPFHFMTTTTIPHLPFEDRYFDFIYAGSVFTHIDDLADAWLAELRRILRPGARLFITVHLKSDIGLLERKYHDSGLAKRLRKHAEFAMSDFDMFTIGRSSDSYVFYDLDYLRKTLDPLFRILSVTEGVRLYQNALLLERT